MEEPCMKKMIAIIALMTLLDHLGAQAVPKPKWAGQNLQGTITIQW
jgi:hypothetical protein